MICNFWIAEIETKKREQEAELRYEKIDQIKRKEQESLKNETEKHVAPQKPARASILKAQTNIDNTSNSTVTL